MKRALLIGLVLVFLLAAPGTAATPSRLDPSFGDDGRVLLPAALGVSGYRMEGKAAKAPDDRVYVLLNERALLALRPDGEVETGFGSGGTVDVFPPDELVHGPVSIAVDHQGRVLVSATIVPREVPDPTPEHQPEPVPTQRHEIFVARYTPDGRPDPGFGSGGRLVTSLGLPPPHVPPHSIYGPGTPRWPRISTSGLAIDAAGRILLSGNHLAAYEVCPDGTDRQQRVAFLARLGEDGRPDPSFGGNGVVILREGPIGAPAADESGGVFASVGTPVPCEISRREAAGYLFRLDGAGAPVTGFGRGGWRPIPEDPYVRMLRDGRGGMLLIPSSHPWSLEPVLRRLRADGSWDRRFGHKSVAEPFPFPKGSLRFADAGVGRGGRIYVTGSWTRKLRESGPRRRFLLFRLDRRGRLDRRYGVVRTGFGNGSEAFARALLITRGGKPLVLGPTRGPLFAGTEGLAMARYLPGR